LAGTAGTEEPNDPDEGVLWRDGRLLSIGRAFGLDTYLTAVNPKGVAVGRVLGEDGQQHAIRYDGGYEYLLEEGGTSVALDINPAGDVVGVEDGSRLVVWQAKGGQKRELPLPKGVAPYRTAAIDDDGTVVAWAGRPDATDTLRLRGYAWHPNGTRTTLPTADIRDFRKGRVVGAQGNNATAWSLAGQTTALASGNVAVATNRTGATVGTTDAGKSLLWVAPLAPQELRPPRDHHQGAVTAINDKEAGGHSYPPTQDDSIPIHWRCR
jgi:hypothetical protein